jgi:hypothetical protein
METALLQVTFPSEVPSVNSPPLPVEPNIFVALESPFCPVHPTAAALIKPQQC